MATTNAGILQAAKSYTVFFTSPVRLVSVLPATFIYFDPAADITRPPSPCIGVCQMNPLTRLCEGCHRDIDEIMQWSSASDGDKRYIWQLIRQRRLAQSNG
jgi:predicted Fe-S protein YdhL (DUF1289 family)